MKTPKIVAEAAIKLRPLIVLLSSVATSDLLMVSLPVTVVVAAPAIVVVVDVVLMLVLFCRGIT